MKASGGALVWVGVRSWKGGTGVLGRGGTVKAVGCCTLSVEGVMARVVALEALSSCCGRGPEVVFSSVAWEGETGLTGEVKSIVDCDIGLPPDVPYPTARVRCSGVNDGRLDTEGTPWFCQ